MANLLTAIRLLLITPVVWAFLQPGSLPGWLLLLLIAVAIASDYFDGKVARARGTASPAGQLFDHGTDFLFVTSSLAAIAYGGGINPLLPLLIAVAFSQYVLDSYFLFHQKQLRMSFLGRWNGVFYFGPVLLMALAMVPNSPGLQDVLAGTAALLAQLLVISTIASIIDRAIAPLRKRES